MEGYEKLSQFMGNSHTDGHFLIFQKSSNLSVQNLLYLQAEIVDLQESLTILAKADAESEDPRRQSFAKDWWLLSTAEDNRQWKTFLQLRSKLKEYCTLHLRQRYRNLTMEDSRQGSSSTSDDIQSPSTPQKRPGASTKMARATEDGKL
jgi:hypothetical protein